jgi:hypothetical protein
MAKAIYDKNNFYSQLNNPLETYNKAQLKELGKRFGFSPNELTYTESCGCSSAASCCAMIKGWQVIDEACVLPTYKMQADQVIWDFLNDPRNYEEFKKIVNYDITVTPGNRFAALYPYAVKTLFGINAKFVSHKLTIQEVKDVISKDGVIQISIIPGHFIAIGDITDTEIIYNDSIAGSALRMSHQKYLDIAKDYANIYTK